MTSADAAKRAAAILERAESLAATSPDQAQALTWVADSWTRLAEALDQHARMEWRELSAR